MARPARDLRGQKFGRLLALENTGRQAKSRHFIWKCLCDCGKIAFVTSQGLITGGTKSCGCLFYNRKHGDKKRENRNRLYVIWVNLKQRCCNPKNPAYKWYGAKGIKICDKWKDNYLAFKEWALGNGYRNDLSIDRIDSQSNYEPANCRFITNTENVSLMRKSSKKHYSEMMKERWAKRKLIQAID